MEEIKTAESPGLRESSSKFGPDRFDGQRHQRHGAVAFSFAFMQKLLSFSESEVEFFVGSVTGHNAVSFFKGIPVLGGGLLEFL